MALAGDIAKLSVTENELSGFHSNVIFPQIPQIHFQ